MKTEERERLLREEGKQIQLTKIVQILTEKDYSPQQISELLGEDLSVIPSILNN